MQALPIGVQDFVQLRQDNLLYVDKTARLLELTSGTYNQWAQVFSCTSAPIRQVSYTFNS